MGCMPMLESWKHWAAGWWMDRWIDWATPPNCVYLFWKLIIPQSICAARLRGNLKVLEETQRTWGGRPPSIAASSICTGVVSVYPTCCGWALQAPQLSNCLSHEKLCLLSPWINWRSILPTESEACVCVCETKRQMSLNTCEEREALKDAGALLSSCHLACTGERAYVHTWVRTKYFESHIIWRIHAVPCSAAKCRVKKWVDSSWKTSLSFNSFLYPISIMGNWFLLSALDQK